MIVIQFVFGSGTVNIEIKFDTCPSCLYKLISWSSCENCTLVDDYNEKRRISNPCKLHRGYAVRIKAWNSCLEEICDSHTTGFLFSNCPYDKCNQWKNSYPAMIAKTAKQSFQFILIDWYRWDFEVFWKEEPGQRFNYWNNKRVWFLWHRSEDTGYYDYKPTDFYFG